MLQVGDRECRQAALHPSCIDNSHSVLLDAVRMSTCSERRLVGSDDVLLKFLGKLGCAQEHHLWKQDTSSQPNVQHFVLNPKPQTPDPNSKP